MAKRKRRPQSTPHEQPKASVEKSNRKLWYTLAGVAVIGVIIVGIGWYVQSQRQNHLNQQPIKAPSQATKTVTPQQTPSPKSNVRRGCAPRKR